VTRRRLALQAYVDGVRSGDRAVLAQAITLVESSRDDDRHLAGQVLTALADPSRDTQRIGVSGVPGAGKSTFVEAMGLRLVDAGHKVAVLAIDPTSRATGGSILGDKTRMTRLAAHPDAYVRPSPTRGHLGGVARRTRETTLLVEAAGYDIVFVETVGVGQSEVAIADLVDSVLLLLLSGAGDDLQGIKRGILEIADVLAIHKADGDTVPRAQAARRELASALSLLHGARDDWTPPVLTCSSQTGDGLDAVWDAVVRHRASLGADGLAARRRSQALRGLWSTVDEALLHAFRMDPAVQAARDDVERDVVDGRLPATVAADRLVALWTGSESGT